MAEEDRINPEVTRSLGDMSGARVAEESASGYTRNFWSALKNGHYRFALTGVAIAAPLSLAVGIGVSMLPFLTPFAAVIIPAFVAAGSLMGVEGFGATGAAAASRAAGLAEKHARMLDAERQGTGRLAAANDQLMVDGRGHHFEVPGDRDKGKLFSWKSGLTGAVMGAASGGLLGITSLAEIPVGTAIFGAIAHAPVISTIAAGLGTFGITAAAPAVAVALAGAAVFGLFGATFGIERKILKSFFNNTDAITEGKPGFAPGQDLGRSQSQETDYALTQQRIRRQEEIQQLEKAYNEKISWGALGGRFKGFAGVVPGVVIGAIVGAIAVAAIAIAAPGAITAGAGLGIAALFSAAGGGLAMKTFSESGMEAGAEATARAIDNEFERNRALRARGITPPAPQKAEESWFNGKTAILAGLAGAAAGIGLTTLIGPAVLGMAGVTLAAHATAAATGAYWIHAATASAVVSGMVGASYGLGGKSLKALAKPAQAIYDSVNFHAREPVRDRTLSAQTCLPVPAKTSAPECVITPEELALLNKRQNAVQEKRFVQIAQQTPQAAGVGV